MKKISLAGLTILLLGLIWYLFIKPSDYIVRFEINTSPGAVNQTLKLWDQSLDTLERIRQNATIYDLTQKLKFGDSVHVYNWNIRTLTDSTSKVVVGVKDAEHSLFNRLKVPFSDTDFEKRVRNTVLDFTDNLKVHIKEFKVAIDGEAEIPSKYVAYIPIKSTQLLKAGGMMKNATYISQTLLNNQAEFNGPPMIEVTEWNMDTDSLTYNFCYPIIRSDRLPMNTDIKYKRIFGKKALKATYNGNYITSDRAWYTLLEYAKRNNIQIEPNPIEIFYNNPNTGGGELTWKAEIYMPIKDDQSE